MINAGVKEIKNNLSRYLAAVKSGDEVIITERGKPIARIIREKPDAKSIRAALAPLVKDGLISLPSTRLKKKPILSPQHPVSGTPVSEMVIEDRR